jgi:hypothetical protein
MIYIEGIELYNEIKDKVTLYRYKTNITTQIKEKKLYHDIKILIYIVISFNSIPSILGTNIYDITLHNCSNSFS